MGEKSFPVALIIELANYLYLHNMKPVENWRFLSHLYLSLRALEWQEAFHGFSSQNKNLWIAT